MADTRPVRLGNLDCDFPDLDAAPPPAHVITSGALQ